MRPRTASKPRCAVRVLRPDVRLWALDRLPFLDHDFKCGFYRCRTTIAAVPDRRQPRRKQKLVEDRYGSSDGSQHRALPDRRKGPLSERRKPRLGLFGAARPEQTQGT